MAEKFSLDETIRSIEKAVDATAQKETGRYLFRPNDGWPEVFSLDIGTLQDRLDLLNPYEVGSETTMFTKKTYVTMVRPESSITVRTLDDFKNTKVPEAKNGVSYEFSNLSADDEYLLFLILKNPTILQLQSENEKNAKRILQSNMNQTHPEDISQLFGRLLPSSFSSFFKLKIEFRLPKTEIEEMHRFCDSFLFQIGYDHGIVLVQQRQIETSIGYRLNRFRKPVSSKPNLQPPSNLYISDLVHRFQSAISTTNPFLEFISYYQIIEYFFETLYYEKYLPKKKERIINTIPAHKFPNASANDIEKIIEHAIRSDLQVKDEEALGLTLKKYIRDYLPELRDKLRNYRDDLLAHYAEEVKFSDGVKTGDRVDLTTDDFTKEKKKDEVIGHLKNRIYGTRNALVHSKESKEGRYTPFKDDEVLAKEVPLLRFIAERIIFESAKSL